MSEDFDVKYNAICQKSKANFLDNIFNKDELKIIFYKNFYRLKQTKGTFTYGYPIKNKTDSECFRISGFNIFMRMHNKIWDEIDKLCNIEKIQDYVTKVQEDKCLTKEESADYNKYLLLQTSIEITSKEILDKNYPDESITSQRQKLLNERFNKISFEAIITNGYGLYVDPVLYEKDSKIYNKLIYLETIEKKYSDFALINNMKLFDTETNISTIFEFFESSPLESLTRSIYNLFNELKIKISEKMSLIESKYNKLHEILNFDKTEYHRRIDEEKPILEQLFQELEVLKTEQTVIIEEKLKDKPIKDRFKNTMKMKKEDVDVIKKENEMKDKKCAFEEIIKKYDDDYVFTVITKPSNIENYRYEKIEEKHEEFKKIVDLLKSFLNLTDEQFDNLEEKFEKFTIENCSFSKLRKMKERLINRILAVVSSPGNVSSVFLIFFTKYVFGESFAKQLISQDHKTCRLNLSDNILDLGPIKNDYLLLNYYGLQNLYPPKKTFNNIKKIKVKIDGTDKEYKLVGVTYNCSGQHSVSSVCYGNECLLNPVEHELINEDTTFEFKLDSPLKSSRLCVPDDYNIELLLYEPIEIVSELKTKLDDFKSRFTNIEEIDEKYLSKYIKYANSKGISLDQVFYIKYLMYGDDKNHPPSLDTYKSKYLKYKNKYLNLKNIISKKKLKEIYKLTI
jgi:hypothetical protein